MELKTLTLNGTTYDSFAVSEADKQEIAELTAPLVDVPTDEHINDLINTALSAIPNAAEVAY